MEKLILKRLQRLEDIESIRKLKHAYCYLASLPFLNVHQLLQNKL